MNKHNREIVVSLKTPIKQYTQLLINVNYTKGGHNYFSGNYNRRGYRLSFTPCSSGNGMRSFSILGTSKDQFEDGFYILIEEVKRFNAKRLDYWFGKVKNYIDSIQGVYERKDVRSLCSIIARIQAETRDFTPPCSKVPPELKIDNKLLTEKLARRFAEIEQTEETPYDVADPLIIAKFFNAFGAGTWYAMRYNPETRLFFGYVSIFGDHCDEWGEFSLDELNTMRGIERDRHFEETRFSRIEGTK